jgi:rare lipoprotein A
MSSQVFRSAVTAGMAWLALAAAMDVRAAATPAPQATTGPVAQDTRPAVQHARPRIDRSGRRRVGKASFYANKFNGRKMADGTRMDLQGDSAASKTLPLGSTAKVTNLETGQSAVVTIRDRGPHVPGRIVDLSPATAEKVGIDKEQGVSKVAVTPITLPPPEAPSRDRGASQGTKLDERPSALPSAPR